MAKLKFKYQDETQVYPKLIAAVNVLCADKGKDCICTSGYRSGAKQKVINEQVLAQCSTNYQKPNGAVYNKAGQCLAAAYGTSNHCFGMALDISDPWFKALTNVELARYGLIKPMAYETWHVELIETRKLTSEQKPVFYFQYTHGLVADGIKGLKTIAKIAEVKKNGGKA